MDTNQTPNQESSFEQKFDQAAKNFEEKAEEWGERMEHQVKKYERGGNVVWAVFLIFIGIIFLLNNIGIIPWSIWGYLWRFWPVFLILAGLKIILGHTLLTDIVIGIFAIGLFGLIGVTALTAVDSQIIKDYGIQLPEWWIDIVSEEMAPISSEYTIESDNYTDVTQRTIELDIGGATFSLKDRNRKDYFSVDANYFENYGVPDIDEEYEDEKLRIQFRQENNRVIHFNQQAPDYDFIVGQPDLLTDLDVSIGAGKGMIDLASLQIGELRCNVGAGALEINLTEASSAKEMIRLDLGAGRITLSIPAEIGLLIEYDVGVGTIKYNAESIADLIGDTDEYQTANYADAERTMDIIADVGVGEIEIIHQ